jgi:plasmid maintenance system antidote protein VapI
MKNVITTKTKLRDLLDARGTRYSWVADRLGVSRPHFHFILEGSRPLTDDQVVRLSDILEVTPCDFLEERSDGGANTTPTPEQDNG